MPDKNAVEIGAALDDVLAQERNALLCGDAETVARIVAKKERLIDAFGAAASQEELRKMQVKILRNHTLMHYSLKGIQAAASRLAELREVREHMQTYDSTGQRKSITAPQKQTLEKRA